MGRRTKSSEKTSEIPSTSVTLRPGRSKPSKKAEISKTSLASSGYCKAWSKDEKKQLLEALKRHGVKNLDKVSDSVSSRTKSQVLSFLSKYHYNKAEVHARGKPVSIDIWLELLHDLHRVTPGLDLSSGLEQVFTMIAYLEPHETSSTEMTPNYENIYLFLASLFHEAPQRSLLSPLDSLVVLDVMRSLTETFKELDLTAPTDFLRQKYSEIISLGETDYGSYLTDVMRQASVRKNSVEGAALIGHILVDHQNQNDNADNDEDECRVGGQQNENEVSSASVAAGNVTDDSSMKDGQPTEGTVQKRHERRVKAKRGRKPLKPKVQSRAPKMTGVSSVSFTVNPLAVPVNLLNFKR